MRDILNTFHGHTLDKVKIRVSRLHATHKAGSFKHHEYDCLPSLFYHLGEGKNIKADSPLLTEKKDELINFKNAFWDTVTKDGATYQAEYERELQQVVNEAIHALIDKWNYKYVEEVNSKFKD